MFNSFYSLIVCCILFGLSLLPASAQYTEDFRAKAVLEKTYTDIKGSPYYFQDWSLGVVKMATGASYKNLALKYDQVTGELIVKDKDGKSLGFADPIAEFKLVDKDNSNKIFRNGYKVNGNSEKSFYEVLYDGGITLLRDPQKNIVEHRGYNSSTAVKSIVETPAYYILENKQFSKIKKDKKSILGVLTNPDQLEKYINDKKLNLKDDEDLAKLILYYDSIKG